MKSNKINLIKVSSDKDGILSSDNYKHQFYKELARIINREDIKYIGFADDFNIFIRLSDTKVSGICKLLKKYNIKYSINSVTDKVISGEVQRLYPDVEKLTPHIFENFRLENETVDNVLDKINTEGINSLDCIDKIILKG